MNAIRERAKTATPLFQSTDVLSQCRCPKCKNIVGQKLKTGSFYLKSGGRQYEVGDIRQIHCEVCQHVFKPETIPASNA